MGKSKDEARAVDDEHIQSCRHAVAEFFNVNLNDDTPETELISPLFQAWAKMADDPDIPLTEWLRDGAPAGIEHDIEVVGVFPPSIHPPSQDFELTAYSEELKNYDSMEDSPHGDEVLGELVNAGYVIKCKSIDEARRLLDGEPIVSKLALITTEKDGVLKRRLILDCRVSGANSATAKYERIVLPKAWDVVRDSLVLLSSGSGNRVRYFVCDVKDAF